jgi:hypothetical protein
LKEKTPKYSQYEPKKKEKTGLQNYLPPGAVEVQGLSTVSEDYPSSLLQQ